MFHIKFSEKAEEQFLFLKNNPDKQIQYKAVGKILGYMQLNLRHPSLNTHKFDKMSSPLGGGVFESHVQNNTPGAYRVFWTYGPKKREITILAIIPHP